MTKADVDDDEDCGDDDNLFQMHTQLLIGTLIDRL